MLWRYDGQPCPAPRCLRCTLHSRRPPQWWRYTGLRDRAAGCVDLFLTAGETWARKHAERGFPFPVEVLPLFADVPDLAALDRAERPHPRPYFLFAGRLELVKGLQDVLRSWQRCEVADLLVAGDGNYRDELLRIADGNTRVRFLGRLPQSDLAVLYRHALATIVPSLAPEQSPLVMIESLSVGTPVIARRVGGLPESLGAGGLLFGDDAELTEAVRTLAEDRETRAECARRGRETYLSRWTPEAHLRTYVHYLERARQRRSGERSSLAPSLVHRAAVAQPQPAARR
jgi:glycosyltransferase involved in cell wall biosynthesis